MGIRGADMEIQALEALIKNWSRGMKTDATIKHVYKIIIVGCLLSLGVHQHHDQDHKGRLQRQ